MNNELIERIDLLLSFYSRGAIANTLQDCKAVLMCADADNESLAEQNRKLSDLLAQQQEADAVFAVNPSDIETLRGYEGQCTILARKASKAPASWARVYLHPPKPAAPDVRCEGCGYMTHHREHIGCVRAALPQVQDGLIAAAKHIEKKVQDYVDDCGSYDRETGATEFPDGGEYVNTLEELAEEIRALSAAKEEGK